MHWGVTKAGRFLSILSGYAFPSSGFSLDESDARLLRGVNVGVAEIRWDETVYWSRRADDGLDEFQLKAGDTVIGMDRSWISQGARVAKIANEDLPCLLLQRVARVTTRGPMTEEYFFRVLSSDIFVSYFTPDNTGVSVPHISPTQIAEFVIPMGKPPALPGFAGATAGV